METLKDRLKAHEGYRSTPYKCPAGYWTVGYGHFLGNGGIEISRMVADCILDEDIHLAESRYLSLGLPELTRNRKDVVVELIFWHGLAGFLKFKKCIKALEKGNWDKAADEMLDSQSGRNYAVRMSDLAQIMREG